MEVWYFWRIHIFPIIRGITGNNDIWGNLVLLVPLADPPYSTMGTTCPEAVQNGFNPG